LSIIRQFLETGFLNLPSEKREDSALANDVCQPLKVMAVSRDIPYLPKEIIAKQVKDEKRLTLTSKSLS